MKRYLYSLLALLVAAPAFATPATRWPLGHQSFTFFQTDGSTSYDTVTTSGWDPAGDPDYDTDKSEAIAQIDTFPVGLRASDGTLIQSSAVGNTGCPQSWDSGSSVVLSSTSHVSNLPDISEELGAGQAVYLIYDCDLTDLTNPTGAPDTLTIANGLQIVIWGSVVGNVFGGSNQLGIPLTIIDSVVVGYEDGTNDWTQLTIGDRSNMPVQAYYSEILGTGGLGWHMQDNDHCFKSHVHGTRDNNWSDSLNKYVIAAGGGADVFIQDCNIEGMYKYNHSAASYLDPSTCNDYPTPGYCDVYVWENNLVGGGFYDFRIGSDTNSLSYAINNRFYPESDGGSMPAYTRPCEIVPGTGQYNGDGWETVDGETSGTDPDFGSWNLTACNQGTVPLDPIGMAADAKRVFAEDFVEIVRDQAAAAMGESDSDSDGRYDPWDNCRDVDQSGTDTNWCDTDADGYGNACTSDVEPDGDTDIHDYLNGFYPAYQSMAASRYDGDCDGDTDIQDYLNWFYPRYQTMSIGNGPSELTCAGTVPCP